MLQSLCNSDHDPPVAAAAIEEVMALEMEEMAVDGLNGPLDGDDFYDVRRTGRHFRAA